MGRELRRVPPDWEHPRNDRGDLQPLYDKEYQVAANEWIIEFTRYHISREHPDLTSPWHSDYYWDWDVMPPNRKYYRSRQWTEVEATHFQVYETVTEGTPISPVLPSREAVAEWLQQPGEQQGYSKAAAEAFAQEGWAPTAVMIAGHYFSGIEGMVLISGDGSDADP